MSRTRSLACLLLALCCVTPPRARAATMDDVLARLDRARRVSTPGGMLRAELSALVDLEGYYIDQRPPGLIFGGDQSFVNPRLSLFLDTQLGRHLYSVVQLRVDRGFDPRAQDNSVRFDEYWVRYTPFADERLHLEVGKFATIVGNWVPRHLSWDNPFINAPVPYENVTIIPDGKVAPDLAAFFQTARSFGTDQKGQWLPVIWGPSYATGAAAFGDLGPFDYAVEVKNAALSSRPAVWDGRSRGFADPTISGRLGVRPAPGWAVGTSFSVGPYLRERAEDALPAGKDLGDFEQSVAGADLRYAWRHWQLWAEVYGSRFEVPNVGDLATLTYYVETRYKLTPALFLALRWNQQFFETVPDGEGRDRAWDRDLWRLDNAVGYRFNRYLQAKLQYSYSHQKGDLQQGEQLVAMQMTLKF